MFFSKKKIIIDFLIICKKLQDHAWEIKGKEQGKQNVIVPVMRPNYMHLAPRTAAQTSSLAGLDIASCSCCWLVEIIKAQA